MARLIDRLLIHDFKFTSGFTSLIEGLGNAEVIVADNVAQYFFDYTIKKEWTPDTFPNVAPPFRSFFIDFRLEERRNGGCLFFFHDLQSEPSTGGLHHVLDEFLKDCFDIQDKSTIRWIANCVPFIEENRVILEPPAVIAFLVRSSGDLVFHSHKQFPFLKVYWNQEVSQLLSETTNRKNEIEHTTLPLLLSLMNPCLLTLSFMHCKNVTIQRETPPAPLSKKHEKNHGRPLVRYHTLNIEPMKQVLRTEGNIETTGLKQALHICRGHFKDYSQGAGLFGKYKGLYWWDSTVRGSHTEGIVDKDYAVKLNQ